MRVGTGTLLEVAAEKDWDVFGVEVSKPAIEQAEKMGIKAFHGELTDAEYPDDHFDIITASEILEHLYEPQKLIKEIARVLRPGGLFWATTPSSKGISYRLMGLNWTIVTPPEHIQLFSKKGMSLMLKNAGFSSVNLQTQGINPFEIINYYYPPKIEEKKFNRVESGYQLNENMENSKFKQKIKTLLNQTLNLTQTGDSLKIFAQK